MQTCKAIVNEGKRKGEQCKFPSTENAYCGRHQRNFQHSEIVKEGKIPCRLFYRGCNNIVKKEGACEDCKTKLCKKTAKCSHLNCKFKTTGEKYCKKHIRDVYRDEEKEKGIQYCDINRGCFTICKEGYTTCETCRKKSYTREKEIYKKRTDIHDSLEKLTNNITQLCIQCGKDYEQFKTRFNKPSRMCKVCSNMNNEHDKKRPNRNRNFRNESYLRLDNYYKTYIRGAQKRNYTFSIDLELFKTLVKSKCYYCHYMKDNEVNGIDRINNELGYEPDNCVGCCETCNMMKYVLSQQFFIELCKIVSGTKIPSNEFYTQWNMYYKSRKQSYLKYKMNAELKRGLPFHITKEEYNILIVQPCYLCGFQNDKGIGLDRVDSSKRYYTIDNVKPCCYTCNLFKKDMTYDTLIEKVKIIASIW